MGENGRGTSRVSRTARAGQVILQAIMTLAKDPLARKIKRRIREVQARAEEAKAMCELELNRLNRRVKSSRKDELP